MNNSELNTRNKFVRPLHPLSIWLKLSLILLVASIIESTPSQPTWAIILVLFAALCLVPIAFQQIRQSQSYYKMDTEGLVWHLPCAVLLAISFLLDRGTLAGIFALPYATWCVETLLKGLRFDKSMTYLITLAVFGFLATGSVWLLFDRFNMQPLHFPTWIVILTSVHFHYAGFVLLTSLLLFLFKQPNDKIIRNVCYALVLGVFLTAIGITLTQLEFNSFYETIAGLWTGASATAAGIIFIKKSMLEKLPTLIIWLTAGISLVLAMIFALLYALRSEIPIDILTLPFMQAVHGTLNALGFGTLMLVGWALKNKKVNTSR